MSEMYQGEEFITILRSELAETVELKTLVEDVAIESNPNNPERLTKPRIVLHLDSGPDELGTHGAAQNTGVEIKIWGYGDAMWRTVRRVADLVDLVLLTRISLPSGGAVLRIRSETGWQRAPVTDAKAIHLTNMFRTRVWSTARAERLGQK